jgi:hypothetical protein
MAKKKLGETEIEALVADEIRQAIAYDTTEVTPKRVRAIEYRDGDMSDTPVQPNRSSVVSRIVAQTIDKMLPGIIRTFTASGCVVEYEPVGPEDEEAAKQASDLVHHIFMKENDGYKIIYDAVYDALLFGNGAIKVYWDSDYEQSTEEEYTGLGPEAIAMLSQDQDFEVLEQEQDEYGLYNLKVKRIRQRGKLCVHAFPPEDLLKNADAIDLEDTRFVAHRCEKTRSELIEMGFDKKIVMALGKDRRDWSEESYARSQDRFDLDDSMDDSTTIIALYECYVRADINEDGVSELIRAYYAGDSGNGRLLEWEECEEVFPIVDIPCEPVPHQWEAQGVAEKLFDLQQIATVNLRAALDNQYAHNNPQPVYVEGSVINVNALVNPKFGQPVIVKKGVDKPLEWRDTPWVADKVFAMLEYIDKQVAERTGMSSMAAALDPETLQNQSATATQLQHDTQYSRVEQIARNIAELGLKKLFRKMLKLVVANQDKAKTVRLRGKWVEMDPRSWNADMDCAVNTGLGTGNRDRDMMMLSVILQSQYALAAAAVQNGQGMIALEMLPRIVQTLTKQAEAAGIKNGDDYYPEFSPEKLQQMAQIASQPQVDPKVELDKAKLQADMQAKQADMQMEGQKAQMDAAMQERQMQFEMEKLAFEREKMNADFTLKAQLEREKMAAKIEQERAQMEADLIVKRQEMELEAQLEREKMMMQMQMQEKQMQAQSAPKYSKVVRNKDGKVEAVETVTQ